MSKTVANILLLACLAAICAPLACKNSGAEDGSGPASANKMCQGTWQFLGREEVTVGRQKYLRVWLAREFSFQQDEMLDVQEAHPWFNDFRDCFEPDDIIVFGCSKRPLVDRGGRREDYLKPILVKVANSAARDEAKKMAGLAWQVDTREPQGSGLVLTFVADKGPPMLEVPNTHSQWNSWVIAQPGMWLRFKASELPHFLTPCRKGETVAHYLSISSISTNGLEWLEVVP